MIRIEINELDYTQYVRNGFSFVELLDEELDNGTMRISHINREDPFEMFYPVDIYIDDTLIKSFFISDDTVELASKRPLKYNHDLTLIERTKKLEKFFIDGKTFTQPIEDGLYDRYTALDVVRIIRDSSPIRHTFEFSGGEPISGKLYEIPQETIDLLEPLDEVEFTFNGSTVREALDEVASLVDGNVYLDSEDNLKINLFNDLKEKIENVIFNNKIQNKNIEYYADTIVSNALNAVVEEPEDEMGVQFSPTSKSFINTRSETFLWNYTDAYIPTSEPIYKVKNVTINAVFEGIQTEIDGETIPSENVRGKIYIRNIFEEEYLQTLEVASQTQADTNLDVDYQNTSLSYRYGEKNIQIPTISRALLGTVEGMSHVVDRGEKDIDILLEAGRNALGVQDVDYEIIQEAVPFRIKIYDVNDESGTYVIYEFFGEDNDYAGNEIYLNIEYKPLKPTVRTEITKDYSEEAPFKTYIQGNQQSRIIELPEFLNKNKAKINRVGLTDYTMTQRVRSFDDVLNLGDFTEDGKTITKREMIFFKDYIRIIYQFNKEFNKSSERTGINTEHRQYEIGESGRTLERNINYNEIALISADDSVRTKLNTALWVNPNARDKIMDTLTNKEGEPVNLLLVTPQTQQPIDVDGATVIFPKLAIPFTKYYGGNQISFHFTMENNFSAGKRLKVVGFLNEIINVPSAYPNQFARMDDITINFNRVSNEDIVEYEEANDFPFIADENRHGDNITNGSFKIFKDNREKLAMNIAVDFIPNNKTTIIGNKFAKSNNFVSTIKDKQLKIRMYNNEILTTRNKAKVPQGDQEENLIYNIDYQEQYIEILNGEINNYNQYAICDDNGNTYLIGRQGNNYINFEFVRFRPERVEGDKVVIIQTGGFELGGTIVVEEQSVVEETLNLQGGFELGGTITYSESSATETTLYLDGGFNVGGNVTLKEEATTSQTVQLTGGFGLGGTISVTVDDITEEIIQTLNKTFNIGGTINTDTNEIIPPETVETPTINSASYSSSEEEITMNVTNNDMETAVIEGSPSTGFTNIGSITLASGASGNITITNVVFAPDTVYARAKVNGRTTSDLDSYNL